MLGFGKKFKLARDSKGISLEQIEEQTRIRTKFLRAIEEEMFHLLPDGVVSRGFVRTYAAQVGLDPAAAVADYQDLAECAEVTSSRVKATEQSQEHHILSVAVGALVALTLLFYVFNVDDTVGTAASGAGSAVSRAMVTLEAGPVVNRPEPAPTTARNPVSEGFSVQLQVHETTWVAVATDGRKTVNGEILEAGAHRRYTALKTVELTIGNAAGLSLQINGHSVPSLGRAGQVRVITITPDNIDRLINSS